MSSLTPRLLVFARPPVPGRVKTRLIPVLGAEAAAALYGRMLDRILTTASRFRAAEAELWCDTDLPIGEDCRELAAGFGISLHCQQGGDLGARMHHALAAAPSEAGAVLIGSDCPAYSVDYLSLAFAALRDHDAVLGPALDGGYVLIGVKRSQPRLFQDILWGGSEVMEQTRERLRELNWRWAELPALRDVDRPEDLVHFSGL